MGEFNEEQLSDMLPLFYSRIFPYASFYKWLSYGSQKYFIRRELSFTLLNDVYIRFQSYESLQELTKDIQRLKPVKIDIGAVYNERPTMKRLAGRNVPLEKELVFDIDLTDYDEVRTCCSGANVCLKCWKFMRIACKVLEAALREDFGFRHLLWVFSGRRGIHCWVCDEQVRKFSVEERDAVAEYLTLVKGGMQSKKVQIYGDRIHYSIRRALNIINPLFVETIVKEQDILGTDERLASFLKIIDDDLKQSFETVMLPLKTSEERWNAFTEHFQDLSRKGKIGKYSRNLVDEIILIYCYPRLDINVSKGLNHLLKAPFCVHPKTGKISIPFNAKLVDKFDPSAVPNLTLLLEEINAYDKTVREENKNSISETEINESRIKDYKKTSLLKPVAIFDEFIRNLERDVKKDINSMTF